MDGFAGFPIRSSTPRGSAFVEFTQGDQAAPPPTQTPTPPPAPERQASLAIRRGAERTVPEPPTALTGRLNTEGDDPTPIVRRDREGGNEA